MGFFRRLPCWNADGYSASSKRFLQKSTCGVHITGRIFEISMTGRPRINILTLENTIEAACQRLVNVQIECLDYRNLIPRYDRPYSFFFLDPPYLNIPAYNHDFASQDFLDLANVLKEMKGKFLMTINDTPEVREIFDQFRVEEVQLKYSAARLEVSRGKQRTELLISNWN